MDAMENTPTMLSQKRRLNSCLLAMALTVLATSTEAAEPAGIAADGAGAMDTLVSAEWLLEHLDDPDLVVIDATVVIEQDESGMRSVNGRANHDAGHIPNAAFADLMGELSDPESRFQFAVPSPEQFAKAMGSLGVGDDSRVVIYDANGMSWAARVWWMLRWIGFDQAALLDGGLAAWKAAGGPLSTEPSNRPARELTVKLRPELIADQDEVRESIENESINLIDSLPEPHYRGDWTMYERSGHIPGASNVPVTSLFDDTGRFLPDDQLADLFESNRNARTITYCGGGIAAASDAFVMTRLGFTDVAVYAASLQEWTANFDNPMDVVLDFEDSEE
jgi:thiosulfate/3-mercaptopyruvate sulfurtransferase